MVGTPGRLLDHLGSGNLKLDKLRVLAETASDKTTSDAQRAALQKTFLKGLSDLQSYMSTAPSDLVRLAYGKPSSSATSNKLVAIPVLIAGGCQVALALYFTFWKSSNGVS